MASRADTDRDLERLYRLHRRDVYRSVLRSVRNPDEAEDVTQIAFLDAYRALQRGDDPERPRAWLLTIAQNVARRRYARSAAGPREVELVAETLVAPDEEGPSAGEIRRAFARLGEKQREALVLREIAGRSYREIAVALDLSVPAVETLLFRARRAFRRALAGETTGAGRRVIAALLALAIPSGAREAAAAVGGWLAARGATAKLAGGLAATAVGTGLVVQSAPQVLSMDKERPAAAAQAAASAPERAAVALAAASVPVASDGAEARQARKAKAAASGEKRPAGDRRPAAVAPAKTESEEPGLPAVELPAVEDAAAPALEVVEATTAGVEEVLAAVEETAVEVTGAKIKFQNPTLPVVGPRSPPLP